MNPYLANGIALARLLRDGDCAARPREFSRFFHRTLQSRFGSASVWGDGPWFARRLCKVAFRFLAPPETNSESPGVAETAPLMASGVFVEAEASHLARCRSRLTAELLDDVRAEFRRLGDTQA